MKKIILIAIVATIPLFGVGVAPAIALGDLSGKKFANCAALNKVYPGGVSLSKSSKNKGGSTKYTPKFNASVYKENNSKDRDRDGIACER